MSRSGAERSRAGMTSKHARRVPEYLQHILDAIDRAVGYVAGMDLAAFERDTRTQDAVILGFATPLIHTKPRIHQSRNIPRDSSPDTAGDKPLRREIPRGDHGAYLAPQPKL